MSNRPICDQDTPDPWIIAANNRFYLTFTCGNRVEVWSSNSLDDFRQAEKSTVWQPEHGAPWSEDVWAPEIHLIDGTWYIYFCAAQPGRGNASHRTLILRSSNPDPLDREGWHFLGPMKGIPDHWNIDATVFSLRPHELFVCYSGWPLGDHSDTQQDLFLMRLASPIEAIPYTLTCISRASLPWERPEQGRRGVNEGPTWLSVPGFQGIVYSANGSWCCDYQMGLVALTGSDPCSEASWQKRHHPLLACDKRMGGPFGPGHASFVLSPSNDGRLFCIYHGTEREDEGWANRKARVLELSPNSFWAKAPTICCATGLPLQRSGEDWPLRGQENKHQPEARGIKDWLRKKLR
ncbi:Extracellular exo-alpha-(1-_5)-L-arabinofuranosidase [Cyphellophora attinorum]|uniref:Extracellular exo-alpha-(1->5)-L-arabinofuranosidase n=1 Tax=Cyphellophora attinorum TaxID=1664694 RepID=A0A0N1NYT7_9EURO|nr:Extracellular exo-alpha-(1->5)-L-arabinofuranosidase [Phialophora attinorum]KPI37254.1 Extracellular exo-alpha-(1->5)-L-arabinofuranosidase [Phialophora attinorum]